MAKNSIIQPHCIHAAPQDEKAGLTSKGRDPVIPVMSLLVDTALRMF